MEYCSAIKEHEMTPSAATRMDLDTVMLSKSEEYKHYTTSRICGIFMWNLNYDINELISKTETDSDIENKLMVTKREKEVGG